MKNLKNPRWRIQDGGRITNYPITTSYDVIVPLCGPQRRQFRTYYVPSWFPCIVIIALILLGVSWCCGNHCWLAFVSVSFESFALRHLVITPSATPRNYQYFRLLLFCSVNGSFTEELINTVEVFNFFILVSKRSLPRRSPTSDNLHVEYTM